ncbi:MAG TPA: CBS domain-containing protein [Polyangiales bacterium]
MTASPRTIEHDSRVSEAMDLMEGTGIRHLPVVRDGKLAGLLTERHLRDALPSILTLRDPTARRKSLEATRVHQIWIENPVTVEPGASLLSVIAVMRRLRASSLPVVEHGALVGIITSGDLITVLEGVLQAKHV